MGQIESRLSRLEDRLRVNQPAETLGEMIEKFNRGAYGGTVMSIVSGAMGSPDREAFFDSLRGDMPNMLIEHFKSLISQNMASAG